MQILSVEEHLIMSDGSKIWHSVSMIFYSVTTIFLVLSAGLFGHAHTLSKNNDIGCLLFKDGGGYNSKHSACYFSITGTALAAVGFAVLANFMGIKIGYSKLNESWIALAFEIAIFVISSLFAVVTEIVLIVGWRSTCDKSSNETGFTCSSHQGIKGLTIASIVFVSLALFLIFHILIFIICKIFKLLIKG